MKTNLLISLLLAASSTALSAAECSVVGAHISSVTSYSDGVVYINTDKNNTCGCAIPSRFGYYKTNPEAKTFFAMAMTAVVSKQLVTIFADTSNCSLIGNTASVTGITLGQ